MRSGRSRADGRLLSALGLLSALAACAHSEAIPPARQPARETAATAPAPVVRVEVQRGYASWYGRSLAGRRTASGERFDPAQMTAAHRTLPFGTWVEVRRADVPASETVRVRIIDRGPFGRSDRIIDLSRAAADKLGILKAGIAFVELRVVQGP
jgi:rare lipoprotein A